MRFSIPSRLLSMVLLLSPFITAPAAVGASRSFIERVKPDDYFAVEKLFPEQFSHANDFVLLRTAQAKPVSVLAIARAPSGDDYVVTLQLASDKAEDGWLKISEDLDATLAQQVLRAIELKLHHQVTLSRFKRTVSKTDSDYWLYQHLSDDRVAAAVITTDDTIDNPAATVFLDDLLGRLQEVIGKEGAERAALLQKLDRTATQIVLAESP